MTHIENSKYRNNLIGDVLSSQHTHKGGNGHQKPNQEFKILERDDSKHLTPYEGTVKNLESDNWTRQTSEEDSSVNAPTGEHKTDEGDGENTLYRDMVHN